MVVEVKLASRVDKQASTFDQASEMLRARGIAFMVVTEVAIRRKKTHQRAAFVLRYLKGQASAAVVAGLVDALTSAPDGLPLGTLLKRCAASPEDLFHLIATRRLTTSPSLPIDGSARVFLSSTLENSNAFRIENWIDSPAWRTNA